MDATRLVLVHDWLTGMRGGEKCLEPLCRRFPEARLYTLIHVPGRVSPAIEWLSPTTSVLQHLPRVEHYYRYLLPLMPWAASWRLTDCDLVLSFSHCVAKAALPPRGVPHVCYCFTPMRYAWHLRESYVAARKSRLGRWLSSILDPRPAILDWLREWDRAIAERVSHFVAISRTVQRRIRECYGRESVVIHPPVDTDFFTPGGLPREEFYLCVSAMAPYKRIDLAIDACNRLKKRLIVIGTGQEQRRLRALAGPTVTLLGWQSDDVIRDHYRRCRALLFPGEEDFGIVPVEAQACGAPVIALGRGGAAETVNEFGSPAPTGVLFEDQSVECLIAAIEAFEQVDEAFEGLILRRQAQRFRRQRYEQELLGYLKLVMGTQPVETKASVAA